MNFYFYFNRLFSFLFFIFFSYSFAQVGNKIGFIDSMQLKEYARLQDIGDYKSIILNEQKLIKESEELDYTKGIIMGYLNIVNSLFVLNKNKESLHFLDIAKRKLENDKDPALNARLYFFYARNYSVLGLYDQSNKNLNKALHFSGNMSNIEERKKREYLIYTWKRKNFMQLQLIDSVFKMERKSLALGAEVELYVAIAERNLDSKKIDSTEYYLNKALQLYQKSTARQQAVVLRSFGKMYVEKKDNKKGLDYFFRSLEISQKLGLKKVSLENYKEIYETYKSMDEVDNEKKFLEKYTVLNDSLNKIEKSILNITIEKFLKEKEEDEKKKFHYTTIAIILIVITICIILLSVYKKNNRYKDILIDKKNKDIDILEKKLDTSYEEVIQLAINDDNLFIVKFKEIYPDFYNNLIRYYPDLNAGDLKFCALVRLNFSNKEIAQYGNMSVRTVESKKYRLRKKIGLPANTDFNKWISDQ